jgi:lipopolysaccharide export system protein LptC
MDRGNLTLTLLLLILVGATWWFTHKDAGTLVKERKDTHVPDNYAENMTSVEMDEAGIPERSLTSLKMIHYADDGSTDLIRPYIVVMEEGKPPWQVRSVTGWVSNEGDLMLLNGKVTIDREAAEGIRPMHLVTRDLRIFKDTDYAETDAPVHMVSLQDTVDSKGMKAWLKAPMYIKLLSQARGRYEP